MYKRYYTATGRIARAEAPVPRTVVTTPGYAAVPAAGTCDLPKIYGKIWEILNPKINESRDFLSKYMVIDHDERICRKKPIFIDPTMVLTIYMMCFSQTCVLWEHVQESPI